MVLLEGKSNINRCEIDDQIIAMRFAYEKDPLTSISYLNHISKFNWINEIEKTTLKAYIDDKNGWPIHVEWPIFLDIPNIQYFAQRLIQLRFTNAICYYITKVNQPQLKWLFYCFLKEIEVTGHYDLLRIIIGCQVDFHCDNMVNSICFSPFGHILLSDLILSTTNDEIIYKTGWHLKM